MDDLEQQLRDAFRKSDPSPYFESKVLAAAARRGRERRTAGRMRWVAAMAAIVVAGVFWQHQHAVEEQARGEAAKARLMLALKVTSAKLDEIRDRVDAQ